LHDLAHLLTKAGNGGNIPPMTASVSNANIMPRASNASSEPGASVEIRRAKMGGAVRVGANHPEQYPCEMRGAAGKALMP
jgi:hypothetical protein